MSTLTRGRLPARVYWTRRIVVLAVLTGLFLGVAQLVRLASGGGSGEPDRAAPMAAEPSSTTAPTTDPATTEDEPAAPGKKKRKQREKDEGPVLAAPEGPCVDSDIAVTPTTRRTVAGGPVTFVLELRTITSPACTWEVSPQSVTVKITSGKDDIWSSRQCPRAIPTEDVVVRDNVSTEVEVTWSARRSDEGCTRLTDWAMPGWYHVNAAALAGEPSDLQFELTAPEPEVVTETVKPDPDKGRKNRKDRDRDGKARDRG